MKKLVLIAAVSIVMISCGDSPSDTSTNPSDTTNLHFNPATEDPNSNPADTMKMVDSSRVKDTSIKDTSRARQ